MHRTVLAALAALGALAGAAAPAGAFGSVLSWPACGATVQACVDALGDGDTVILTADATGQTITIRDRSFSILAGPGVRPDVALVRALQTTGSGFVFVQGLDIGELSSRTTGGFGHVLVVDDVSVTRGIDVTSSVPGSVRITDSRVSTTDHQEAAILIAADLPSGSFDALVAGNRLSAGTPDDAGPQVRLDRSGGGTTDLAIRSNIITGGNTSGAGAAAAVNANVSGESTTRLRIAGNTFDRLATGALEIRDSTSGAGSVRVDLFGNAITRTSLVNDFRAFLLPVTPSFTLVAGHNLLWRVPSLGIPRSALGRRTVVADPRYRRPSVGDYRPLAGSPLIDAAPVCSPAGIHITDARGRSRIAGATADIGAVESGAGAPSGIVAFGTPGADLIEGTDGDDILCGVDGGDRIRGLGGDDWIDGGRGPDELIGGADDDTLCGRDGVAGNDRLAGGRGGDRAAADRGDRVRSTERRATCLR